MKRQVYLGLDNIMKNKSIKICIDPGHGGNDSGAGGPTGLEEASVALDLSSKLSDALNEIGVDTILTREDDTFIELGERCDIANEWEADYFVSVHLNSNGPTAIGIETLYKSENGKKLAAPVHEALIEATADVDRGLKYRDNLYVLNGTNMPAILVEVGFISHPDTEEQFRSEGYREVVVGAIVDGLAKYLGIDSGEKSEPLK